MSRLSSKFPILAGASWYFCEKFIRLIGAFLIGAWVARHLGPEGYGTLAYALALIAVLGFIGSLGIESLVVRDLVEGQRDPSAILSTYFFIRLFGSLLVPLLATAYLWITHTNDPLLILLTTLCSGSVVFGSFDVADCWLQAKNQARTTSLIRLVGFLAGAMSRCLLILSEAKVEWFAFVFMLESAVIAAIYYRLLQRNGLTPNLREMRMTEFKHLVMSGKMMVLSGLTVAIYSKIDTLVIGALMSKEDVGSYAIAASMCAAWNMVGMSVSQAWASRISKARIHGEQAYVNEVRNLLKAMLIISLTGSIVLTIFSDLIFTVLLGPAFASSSNIFPMLIWASVPIFLGIATSPIIVNERTYWVSMVRTSVGMAVSTITIVPAVNHFGTMGAAGVVILSACINVPLVLVSRQARQVISAVMRAQPIKNSAS